MRPINSAKRRNMDHPRKTGDSDYSLDLQELSILIHRATYLLENAQMRKRTANIESN